MSAFLENKSEYGNLAPQTFFVAASKATEEETKPILDPVQWKHWQEICAPKNPEANPPKTEVNANQPPQPAEPEDLERAISDFLQEKTVGGRKRLLAATILKAEDAARVAQLPADMADRLRTAARGDAEESLAAWKTQMDQFLRSNFVRDATAQNVKQRLASLDDYYFGDRFSPFSRRDAQDKESIWDKSVKNELTDQQRGAWQKEVDGRSAYREKAIASALMAEFDRKNPITPGQWEKLEPIIAGILKDYSPEIANNFSSSNDTPWYLQYYSMFMPFAGVPEKDFKAILTKEQWDRWTGSNECSNSANYWENIQQNHEQRVKAKQ